MGDLHRTKEELLRKIRNRNAVVGVVGLGYVGLPLAVEIARVGFRVLGVERNPKRVDLVNSGKSYIDDVPTEKLAEVVREGRLEARVDFSRVPEMDVIVIAVPTPLTRNLVPDLQYVEGVTRELSSRLRPGQLVSLESTTYPGTTEEVMLPILERGSGLRVEEDFFLAHSPERVDPGNKNFTTKNTSKVVGGVGPASLEVASAFYAQVIDQVVPVSSAKAAELVKVYENTFRAVNIALVNELALLCDRMGLNVWEVLDAAFTKPFGIMPFYPGPGVGGHCIPIDPHYLEWKAKEFNFNTHFIALAGEINRKMPEFVLEKVRRILNDMRLAPSAARVLLLGVAYKKDVSDLRESPALDVLRLLRREGAQVAYHDPFVPELSWEGISLRSVPLTDEVLREHDLVVLTTDHTSVDYEFVRRHARKILDTRGVYRRSPSDNVVLL
ncbi:nucleotide sugar dehydrogenase [Brockia lithotrophica]|uniref:UDP-N-acetyl-D-glucosamine dehydrogenase n=1 Tax=Brockia lithotrophica TaxID=933949 RepID=A0A660KVV6_9BACL|nr:nucleotide sugar dehydrogenase [Brockia lithotrophica]RKQ85522.1 UDP-N-acetyl-D-glucosamine dehydrogenase [Brockia lithotrophica]